MNSRLTIAVIMAVAAFALAAVKRTEPPAAAVTTSCWRSLAADCAWLRGRAAWERRDENALRRWVTLVLVASPDSVYYRVNAARMIAFDVPAWGDPAAPAAMRAMRSSVCAAEAIALLRIADASPPLRAELLCEAGTIALYGKRDAVLAAALFRESAELRQGAWHAGRIHARLLAATGRRTEACTWLASWVANLPSTVPRDQRELTVSLLAELNAPRVDPTGRNAIAPAAP